MKEPIVVLNSGGYDSVVLMNFLYFVKEEDNIHSLHFSYGELNERPQRECVNAVCEKVGAVNKVIKLPRFDWTTSRFYVKGKWDEKTQYLEYRNLVFLSYAVSYAESIGAKKIYLAVLMDNGYTDTSDVFYDGLNSITAQSGIEVIRPFSWVEDKADLIPFAVLCDVWPEDYFSCDKPHHRLFGRYERCHACMDCTALDYVNEQLTLNRQYYLDVLSGKEK